MKLRSSIFLSLVVLALLGSGNGVFGKIALRQMPPFSFTALRFFVATLIVWIASRGIPKTSRTLWFYLVPLLLSINVVLFAIGVRLTSAIASQILYGATPILTAVFAWLLFQKPLRGRGLAGIGIGLAATVLVVFASPHEASGVATLAGNLILAIAVIAFALHATLSETYLRVYRPMETTLTFCWMTAVGAGLISIFDLSNHPTWWEALTWQTIAAFLFVSILGTSLFYILYQYVIQKHSANIATMMVYLSPIAAWFWAALFLHEHLTPVLLIGMLLSFLGVWLVTSDKNLHKTGF